MMPIFLSDAFSKSIWNASCEKPQELQEKRPQIHSMNVYDKFRKNGEESAKDSFNPPPQV